MSTRDYANAAKDLLILAAAVDDGEIDHQKEMSMLSIIVDGLKVEVEKQESRVDGWHIKSLSDIACTGRDLLDIHVTLWKGDTKSRIGGVYPKIDSKVIDETLEPPFETNGEPHIEEYGGFGRKQQSIVITVCDDYSERSASIQLEIDYQTGTFEESSLHKWEIDVDDTMDEDDDE